MTQYEKDYHIISLEHFGKFICKCSNCGHSYGDLIRERRENNFIAYRVQCPKCNFRTLSSFRNEYADKDWENGFIWNIAEDGYPVYQNGQHVSAWL